MPSTGDPKHDAENQGPTAIIVSTVFTLLGILFVAARLTSRRISGRRFALDDAVVIFSVILNILFLILAGVAVGHGAGRHVDTLEPSNISKAMYFNLVAFVPGVLSFMIPKFAVLLLLVKILDPGIIHKRVMWVISVVYGMVIIAMVVINFAQCTPAATQWGGAQGKCWPRSATFGYSLMVGVVSAMFDFYLAIYPSVVLSRLNMGWKKKLGLASALGFGYFAGAITVYKCTTLTGLGAGSDLTWNFEGVVLWTSVEANCVLIGACIPTLYPLITKLFGTRFLRTAASSARTKEGDPTIQTFGASDRNKKKPDDLSVLGTMDYANDDAGGSGGGSGSGNGKDRDDTEGPEMAERQRTGHSGETLLRDEESQEPIEKG